MKNLRRLGPASPLSGIRGKLSRRARASSGGSIMLPTSGASGEEILPVHPDLDARMISGNSAMQRRGSKSREQATGVGTDSALECFGDISSGADQGGDRDMDTDDDGYFEQNSGFDDVEDGAGSSSTNNSGASPTTSSFMRKKASPLARLKRFSSSNSRRRKASSSGATMSLGRTWLGPSSPLDSIDGSRKSPHTMPDDRTALSTPESPEKRRCIH